jgi:D-alanyl-D-alanine carboxypeptidase (penicillin-binding protein 5/6)
MSKMARINWFLALALTLLLGWRVGRVQTGEVLPAAQAQVINYVELLRPSVRVSERESLVASEAAQLGQKIGAESVVVIDVNSKQVLWSKNAEMQLYPASTTKIITALVARQLYQGDEIVVIEREDLQWGNNVGWQAGEGVRAQDLIKALLIMSANEAGLILANHVAGGYEVFVAEMNRTANNLGMTKSSFANPQGFDAEGQQTSSHDLALATLELLRDSQLRAIVATTQTQVTGSSGKTYVLRNTNQLLTRNDLAFKVLGVKTGTTDLAREALVSLIEKDEQQILIVVLAAKNRYNDTITLANFVWENFIWQKQTLNLL